MGILLAESFGQVADAPGGLDCVGTGFGMTGRVQGQVPEGWLVGRQGSAPDTWGTIAYETGNLQDGRIGPRPELELLSTTVETFHRLGHGVAHTSAAEAPSPSPAVEYPSSHHGRRIPVYFT